MDIVVPGRRAATWLLAAVVAAQVTVPAIGLITTDPPRKHVLFTGEEPVGRAAGGRHRALAVRSRPGS
ncbi:hypothetical protein WIS52_28920 [Pseudonocardia nematodicida]|uniref:Uncharacterized protein n=1 Tax=Pseudonocardia nematodicida TaxID=1206997 RepID=A0ABV1KKN2_9PSEU